MADEVGLGRGSLDWSKGEPGTRRCDEGDNSATLQHFQRLFEICAGSRLPAQDLFRTLGVVS